MFVRLLCLIFCVLFLSDTTFATQGDLQSEPILNFKLSTGISKQKVYLATELFRWDKTAFPMIETAQGEYSISISKPWLYKLEYKFIIDEKWITDPGNLNQTPDSLGSYNSYLNLDFQDDHLLSKHEHTPGVIKTQLLLKDLEGAKRKITTITPNVSLNERSIVAVYFQDGQDYLEKSGIENLLANLSLDKDMPIIVGVFIPPKDRFREYGELNLKNRYVDFLSDVVVPAIEKQFKYKNTNQQRLLIGSSLGGLISLYTGLTRPEIFGAVAVQSGSFWYRDHEIMQILKKSTAQKLELFIDVGFYEGILQDSELMLDTNRNVAKLAKSRGYNVYFAEYPTTHDWIAWRNRLSKILMAFYKQPAGTTHARTF